MENVMSNRNHPEPLLTIEEAATFLNVTPRALKNARLDGTGPAYVRLNQTTVRYRPEALRDYVAEHEVGRLL
jgi:hypothetical protein